MLALLASAPAVAQDAGAEGDGAPQPPEIVESQPTIVLPPPASSRREAYDRSADTLAPLTPEEIRRFRRELEAKQDAMYGGPPPETTSCLYPVSLETGATIPTVEIAPGYVSSIVFVDAYGNPWPIVGPPAVGNPELYSVTVIEGGGSEHRNVLSVSAKATAGSSNLSVQLRGKGLPVNVQLHVDRKKTCLRADMQISSPGPNSNPTRSASSGAPPATPTDVMMQYVDGVPPQGATPLETSDAAIRAWKFNGQLYLRTRKTVLSPSWLGVAYGTAGLRVYRMATTPLVLYSDGGKTRSLEINLSARRAPAMATNQ